MLVCKLVDQKRSVSMINFTHVNSNYKSNNCNNECQRCGFHRSRCCCRARGLTLASKCFCPGPTQSQTERKSVDAPLAVYSAWFVQKFAEMGTANRADFWSQSHCMMSTAEQWTVHQLTIWTIVWLPWGTCKLIAEKSFSEKNIKVHVPDSKTEFHVSLQCIVQCMQWVV